MTASLPSGGTRGPRDVCAGRSLPRTPGRSKAHGPSIATCARKLRRRNPTSIARCRVRFAWGRPLHAIRGIDARLYPGYTALVKTAVSLPDPVFEAAEQLARRLRLSRSQLYAEAIRRFVAEHRGRGVTELLNQVYGAGGTESDLDPVLSELQLRVLESKDSWDASR